MTKSLLYLFISKLPERKKIVEHWYISMANYIMQSEHHLYVFESDKQIQNIQLRPNGHQGFVFCLRADKQIPVYMLCVANFVFLSVLCLCAPMPGKE